jgi:hypothetical protein
MMHWQDRAAVASAKQLLSSPWPLFAYRSSCAIRGSQFAIGKTILPTAFLAVGSICTQCVAVTGHLLLGAPARTVRPVHV